jgi:hypothetical protein
MRRWTWLGLSVVGLAMGILAICRGESQSQLTTEVKAPPEEEGKRG